MGLQLMPLLSPTLHTVAVTTRPKLARNYSQNLQGNRQGRLKITRPAHGRARLTASATWDPGSIADGDEAITTIAVAGALMGDRVDAAFSLTIADLTMTAWVSVAGTVTVSLANNTGGAIDLASGTVNVAVDTAIGNASIFGANLPNPWAGRDNTQVFRGRNASDGTAVTDANAVAADYTFQTTIAYAAFSNYNWVAMGREIDPLILQQGTTNGGYGISDVGGYAALTFSLRTVAADSVTVDFDLAGLPYDLYEAGVIGLQVKNNGVQSVLTTDYTVSSTVDATSGEAVTRVTFLVAPTTGNVTIRPYLKASAQLGVALVTPVTMKAAAANALVDEEVITRDLVWGVLAAPIAPTLATLEATGR